MKDVIRQSIGPLMAISLLMNSVAMGAKEIQPNIVFIMADDLGWTDLGVMGSDYYETPNIDRLASQGMLFTNAYAAAANSAPSRACFMTGKYTPRHGVFTVSPSARGDKTKRKLIPIKNTDDVRTDFVTMAEALQKCGYQCGHIGKWHLGDDRDGSGTGPLSQGFVFNIAGERAGSPYSYFYPYCNTKKQKCHLGLDEGRPGEYLTDRLTDEAIDFMGKHTGKPFFLHLAHHAVHVPLKAPRYLVEKYEKKVKGKYHTNPVYAAMIESLDQSVGRVCRAIDSLGIADKTIIIFYSDNGGSEPVTDNYPLREGKGSPYEGGTRVPLIMKWPGKIRAGVTCDVPISGIDFYPTFVDLAHGKQTDDLDGKDIFSLIEDNAYTRDLYWHFPAYLQSYAKSGKDWRATPYSSIRSGDWKLIYYYEDKSVELFNLKEDLEEQYDLSQKRVDKKDELYSKLMNWLKETKAPIPTELNSEYVSEK